MSARRQVVRSAADAERGPRENLEDVVYSDDSRGIYIVIDGMGGYAAGEEAARIALQELKRRLERQTGDLDRRLREAIANANNAIYQAARENPEWQGMACVLTAAVVADGFVTIGHVGDTRLYKVTANGRTSIAKLTRDQSPVGEMEDLGRISEFEAMRHPMRNEVYRDVGSRPFTAKDLDDIEVYREPFQADEALLLCSDGLTDALPRAEIEEIIDANVGNRPAIVSGLLREAAAKGKDNIGVVWVEGEEFGPSLQEAVADPASPPPTASGWRWRELALGFVFGLAVGGALAALALSRRAEPPRPTEWLVGPTLPHARISEALALAKPGDRIVVDPGEYRDNLHLSDGVTLTARLPRETVILAANPELPALSADGLRSATVEGLLVRGDDSAPLSVGILVRDATVTLRDCEVTGARLAGVQFEGASSGALQASSVRGTAGHAVVVKGTSDPRLVGNLIALIGPPGTEMRAGLVLLTSKRPLVVRDNQVSVSSGTAILTSPPPIQGLEQTNVLMGKPPLVRPLEGATP